MSESAIFKAAVKLPPDRRAAYLDQACVANSDMRREVESLLRAHDASGSFLKNEPGNSPLTGDYDPITEGPGTTVGPYKLMEQIGEGGFGLVFVAEQQHPVRRKVALKIIKPGMDTREVIARFEAERQALALMDHPHIARVLDAGATDSGRPFFVMELVKGIPINEYCDQQQLTARERLELFLSVCQAVQHAHTKGIIHRDLKPSNILVAPHDGVPVVKVIDFGVAKAIGQQLTEKTIYTRFTQMIGTPLYMSPEQAEVNQLDVDIRSDVYSLGVLLYELLTGTTPFDRTRFATAAYDEIRRIIKEEEPPKPSTRLTTMGKSISKISSQRKTEPAKLSALVKGDLDWIVMKALEKDRSRRDETATTFAADVRRFLAEEPIEARPPSAMYRLHKLTRRNRALLTTAAMIASALFIGLGLSIWQAVRATQAERMAIADRDEKEQARLAETEQREIAVAAQQKAQQERDAANAARDQLRRTHYAASMNLISTAWEADHVARAVDLLEEQRPKIGEADLRGFEWHYWDRLCHAERRLWKFESSKDWTDFELSGDGRRIVCWKRITGNKVPGEDLVRVLDVASGNEVFSVKIAHDDADEIGNSVIVSRDGSRFVFHSNANLIRNGKEKCPLIVYDVASGRAIFSEQYPAYKTMALSNDGRLLVMAEEMTGSPNPRGPNSLKICDLSNPAKTSVVLKYDDGPIRIGHLCFSPDGSRLANINSAAVSLGRGATRNWQSTIDIWDTANGQCYVHKSVEDDSLLCVGFSPDGQRLITLGTKLAPSMPADSKSQLAITVWDGAAGEQLTSIRSVLTSQMIEPAGRGGFRFVLSPSSERAAIWQWNKAIQILDLASGAIVQSIKTPTTLSNAAFTNDGTRLVTAGVRRNALTGSEEVIQEWDIAPAARAQPTSVARTPRPSETVVHSADGQRQAVFAARRFSDPPDTNPEVTIRDGSGKVIYIFKMHKQPVAEVIFSPDGRWVYSQDRRASEAILWEAETGEVRWSRIQAGNPDKLRMARATVQFSPDGRWLALREPEDIKVICVQDKQRSFTIDRDSFFHFSPDSKFGVSLSRSTRNEQPEQSTWRLWHLETGRVLKAATTSGGYGSTMVFSPDSRYFTLGADTQIFIHDTATGEVRSTLQVNDRIGRVFFRPDGKRLVVCSNQLGFRGSSSATVWDVATGQILFRLEGHNEPIQEVAFSSDGRRIATAALAVPVGKGEVKVWDAVTGRELLNLAHSNLSMIGSADFSFSPDGHRLIMKPVANRFTGHLMQADALIWDATPRREQP